VNRAKSPRILLLNPPIYDFSAYDFWLKPYGLLRVGGMLRGRARLDLFDYLDRKRPGAGDKPSDPWGRGHYLREEVEKPEVFRRIPRRFRRIGIPRRVFLDFLAARDPYDFVLVAGSMTYWYQGVREAIEDIRRHSPEATVILGGVYPSLCPEHAESRSGADLVVRGGDLAPLWKILGFEGDPGEPPYWEGYEKLEYGVVKLTDGCRMRCTYCASGRLSPVFRPRERAEVLRELRFLSELGVRNVAFYDDALLLESECILLPFLDTLERACLEFTFHTPNAIHARFLSPDLARRLVESGFRNFFLGFETVSARWHERTGGKTSRKEFEAAVENLRKAGAEREDITAYVMLGHPLSTPEEVERSIRSAAETGARCMLAEFSPIPGTEDGEICRRWVDLEEPLCHNKTAFPIFLWGEETVNELKELSRAVNRGDGAA